MCDSSTLIYETRPAESVPSFSTLKARFRRPRVVALGGGAGLPVVLRSLKCRLFPGSTQDVSECSQERLTAIVSVTDDGGSSGRLRREFNILPPGDMNTLGQVLPSTLGNVSLFARFEDGSLVKGESSLVKHEGRIKRVFLRPSYVDSPQPAVEAIEAADAIVIGPGSLFTSVIPNLLVKDIADAIRRSRAKKIYICNLMTEPGETDGYTASDHVSAILEHTEYGFLQYVILNKGRVSHDLQRRYARQGYHPVRHDAERIRELDLTTIVADLMKEERESVRHDADRLGRLLMELI